MKTLHNPCSEYFRVGRPRLLLLLVLAVALSACQKPVFLMPTPEALRTGEIDVFERTPDDERTLVIPVAYATNRLPAENPDKDGYTREFDDNLRLGIASVRVGDDPDATWEDLHVVSTILVRDDVDIPLRLHEVQEYYVLPPDMDPANPPAEVRSLFEALDEILAESRDPDLLIFVHGANNNFYRSIAQAAQYRHFTGRQSVVLAFIWPSMENILRYNTDVKNANYAAPLLANLVDLVATHTNVRYINLLGYSLGAVVVSNGLNKLRNDNWDEDPQALKSRLKIGEVYYAAGDLDFKLFVEQLQNYQDIVGRVSLTVNLNDSALRFSQFSHGASRAGRPDPDELSVEETEWLIEASHSPNFDVIEIESAVAPYEALKAHDYWYNNPRVSTDVIIQMLSHAPPDKRGLEPYQTARDFEVWFFPENYRERAIAAVKALREEFRKQQEARPRREGGG